MRHAPVIAALAVTVTLAGCGGAGGQSKAQGQSRSYAAGEAALHRGDLEAAYKGFHDAGGYRDAPQRLLAVRRAAVPPILALARSKLRTGHPRAALALAGIATQEYGDTSPDALAVLHQAQTAQALHHQRQLTQQQRALQRQGSAGRPSGGGP